MKKILGLLFLIASFNAAAQYSPNPGNYGTQGNRYLPLKVLHIPTKDSLSVDDTVDSAQIFINSRDSSLVYRFRGHYYEAKGGQSVNTDSIWAGINARLLIADTGAMLNPYIRFQNLDSAVAAGGFLIGPISNSQLQHSAIFFSSTNIIFSGGGTAALGGTSVANADTVNYISSIKRVKDTAAALRAAIATGGSGTDSTIIFGYGLKSSTAAKIKTGIADTTVVEPIVKAQRDSASFQSQITTNTTAIAGKQNTLGYTAANDANVVHNTGNETIAGSKTFSSTITGATTGNVSNAQRVTDSTTYSAAFTALQAGKIDSVTFSTTADSMYTYKNGTRKGYLYYIGNAATVTTNANLTGPITSVGNATTINNINGITPTYYDPTSSIQTQLNNKVTVVSFTKNATRDSIILLLSDGSRLAVKDSVGAGGGGADLGGNGTYTANQSNAMNGFSQSFIGGQLKTDTVRSNVTLSPVKKWVIGFGTSIMAGYLVFNFNGTVDSSKIWMQLFCNGLGQTMINKGVPSLSIQKRTPATSGGNMIDNVNSFLPAYNSAVDTLLLLEGNANDVIAENQGNTNYSSAHMTADLTTIVDTALARGWPANRIIIIPDSYISANKTIQDSLFTAMQGVATSLGTKFIGGVYPTSFYLRNQWFQDGSIHPGIGGHSTWAQIMLNAYGNTVLKGNQRIAINDTANFNHIVFTGADTADVDGSTIVMCDAGNHLTKAGNERYIKNYPGSGVRENGSIYLNGSTINTNGNMVSRELIANGNRISDSVNITKLEMYTDGTTAYIQAINDSTNAKFNIELQPQGGNMGFGTTPNSVFPIKENGTWVNGMLAVTGSYLGNNTAGNGFYPYMSGSNLFMGSHNGDGSTFGSKGPDAIMNYSGERLSIGNNVTPTAMVHISRAGTATAGTSPFKLTTASSVLLTTPEAGAIEVLVDSIYYTGSSAVRNKLAYIASPTFTGTPAAPTASTGTNTTQIATTAFVQATIAAIPAKPIIVSSAYIAAQTTAQTITTYTTGGADSSYSVSAGIDITALSVNVVTTTVTYTDETNTSRTITLFPMGSTSSTLTTGPSNYSPLSEIRVKASTIITLAIAASGVGSQTYNAWGSIIKLHN